MVVRDFTGSDLLVPRGFHMPSRLKTTLAGMDRTPVHEGRLASARKSDQHPSAEDAYWTQSRKVC